MFEKINEALHLIKKEKPLILNITNYVTMDFVANGLLAVGASPVMSQAEEEIEAMLAYAKMAVINPGTVNESFIALAKTTCNIANRMNIPIVLDPVGAGATPYRSSMNDSLINEFRIAIIRGNADEIMALAGRTPMAKGVDSLSESHEALESARFLSEKYNTCVVVSGKTDMIVDRDMLSQLNRGSAFMSMVTGMGCLLSSVTAVFHAIEKNRYEAANMATLFYAMCGEIAEKKSAGPGSFKLHFLDALSQFLPDDVNAKI